MTSVSARHPWGTPPWEIDFKPRRQSMPAEVDFAVVGGGFTGLAAAAWMRYLDPSKSVAVLEAGRIGAGASGRTGGMVLAETAAGDKPGLGDVLGGFQETLATLDVDCELSLAGAWEIGRRGGIEESPIEWNDSGTLRVTNEIPGGTLDPGKLVSGLARAGAARGVRIFERSAVKRIRWPKRAGDPAEIVFERGRRRGRMRARKILLATNALSLRVSGLERSSEPRLTLAALTEPLGDASIAAAGRAEAVLYGGSAVFVGAAPRGQFDRMGRGAGERRAETRAGEAERAGERADAAFFAAAQKDSRASSSVCPREVHASLGRADIVSRELDAGVRLAFERGGRGVQRDRAGGVCGPWCGSFVVFGEVGGGGAAGEAGTAGVGKGEQRS